MGELEARRPFPARMGPKGNLIYKLITTTDHKLIGIMYCVACFIFFFIGGLMALLMRTELALPGLQFLSNEQFNQLFTMHGTIMLLFYATPDRVRLRQLGAAAADRRARRGVPAAERLLASGCSCSARRSRSPASSPPAAPPTSAGPPTRR